MPESAVALLLQLPAHACYRAFLSLNGVELDASEEEKYVQMLSLAEGPLSETNFAAWPRPRLRTPPGEAVHAPLARYR